jgi:hypothetical protein
MEPLAAGEQQEPRPEPINPPQGPPPPQPRSGPGPGRRTPPPQPPTSAPRDEQPPAASGALSIRVQPPDAETFIDGERWQGAVGEDQLVVDLPEGSHTVEVRKAGFRTYVTDVQVRRGETTSLNVSLRPQ